MLLKLIYLFKMTHENNFFFNYPLAVFNFLRNLHNLSYNILIFELSKKNCLINKGQKIENIYIPTRYFLFLLINFASISKSNHFFTERNIFCHVFTAFVRFPFY